MRYVARYFCSIAAALVVAMLPLTAYAGEAEHEIEDEQEHGAPFFGEAKDLKGLRPLEGVRIKAQLRGTTLSVIVATDEDGRFRLRGFGKEIDPVNIEVTCTKEGYRPVDVMRRSLSKAQDAPIEVECLLERI